MNIDPKSKTLETILTGLETKYNVPDYQRDYSWTPNEVEILWQDIISSYNQKSEYFMGTLVLKLDDIRKDIFDIVDGQQRLATFSILFSVIASIASEYANNPDIFKKSRRDKENNNLARRIASISESRLREANEPDNYYLKLNRKDNDVFQRIVRRENDSKVLLTEEDYFSPKSESRLIKNKKIFYKLILSEFDGETPLEELFKLLLHVIKNLQFITIEVKTDYDAFLLFESLNSKGMDLSVADLVKNKILMRAHGVDSVNEILLSNWDKMTTSIDDSRLSSVDFLRVYWDAVRGINSTKKELYKNVSVYIDDQKTNIVDFSNDLRLYAEGMNEYASINLKFPSCMHEKLPYLKYCGEINTLKYTICYPVIMYAKHNRPEILNDLTRLSLSFLFRWITICDLSVGGAKKVFDQVMLRLKNSNTASQVVLESFHLGFDKINDESFVEAFKQFRTQDNQIAKYILSKYYLSKNKEQIVPNYGEVHLEHVLPQQPSKWLDSQCFVVPAGTQIKDYIYNLGNMTLLHKPINQKIKNSIFSVKIEEFSDSIFEDTKSIFTRGRFGEKWGPVWIAERTDAIAEKAPEIWTLKL